MAWISVPVQGFYSFKNNFYTTKHHKSRQSGAKLTLSEIVEYGSPTDQKFIDNVLLEELSENEIDDFLNEVLDNLENKSQFSEEDKELNMKFWENYKFLQKNIDLTICIKIMNQYLALISKKKSSTIKVKMILMW